MTTTKIDLFRDLLVEWVEELSKEELDELPLVLSKVIQEEEKRRADKIIDSLFYREWEREEIHNRRLEEDMNYYELFNPTTVTPLNKTAWKIPSWWVPEENPYKLEHENPNFYSVNI